MWVFFLLIACGAAWWFLGKGKASGQQIGNVSHESHGSAQEADPSTVRIKLNFNADEVGKLQKEFQEKRMKWSGKPYAPFRLKKFSDDQWPCIRDAVGGKRIVKGNQYTPASEVPEGVALHSARTINSLVKHGFIEANEDGSFVCTDLGAKAYEQIPFHY